MIDSPDLHLLFPTTFSDACHHAGQTLAQLARVCRVAITVVHVERAGLPSRRARNSLHAFLRDVPGLHACDRILTVGHDPAAAVAALCRGDRYDVVLAPASPRRGLRDVVRQSFRARLLARAPVPLWTAGAGLPAADLGRPIRTIACAIDFERPVAPLIHVVTTFARRIGASVQLLALLPSIDEGMMSRALASDAPLMPDTARRYLEALTAGIETPRVAIATGPRDSGLRPLLAGCAADLVFVDVGRTSAWARQLSRQLDDLPCPVVCLDGTGSRFPRWSFEEPAAARSRVDGVLTPTIA